MRTAWSAEGAGAPRRLEEDGMKDFTPVRRFAATLFGLVVAVTPLALWVAWSDVMLLGVLLAGAAAAVLCGLLADDEDSDPARPRESGPAAPEAGERFLGELTDLGPWIHHNRLRPDARFAARMDRLRQALQPERRE
jgi:hypothetical protein